MNNGTREYFYKYGLSVRSLRGTNKTIKMLHVGSWDYPSVLRRCRVPETNERDGKTIFRPRDLRSESKRIWWELITINPDGGLIKSKLAPAVRGSLFCYYLLMLHNSYKRL